ncbi:MAG: ATP-binding cassette domain-containing protein [Candidatus Phytoplasma sp.]|nr:ATP-binding cassette domain-containing protein [Phytoplasma sp.]
MFKLRNICKVYQNEDSELIALNNVNLEFPDKGLVFIVGKSGSGKSTLLNILGSLETPTSGEITFKNNKIDTPEFRKEVISFVFQDFNLLYDLSLEENLTISEKKTTLEINKILRIVGLEDKKGTKVRYLSGGEKQRLSIARALSKKFDVMLLDEPTGNLDSKNSETIFDLMKMISKDKLVITVTHDYESALKYGDYLIEIQDGFVSDLKVISNQISIQFRKDELETNKLLELYETVSKEKEVEVTFITEDKIQKILVTKKTFLSQLTKKINEFSDEEQITISIQKETKKDKLDFEYHEDHKKGFPFLFQFKYAISLVFMSKIRLMITFLLLTITAALLFVHTSIVAFNTVNTLDNAIKQIDRNYYKLIKSEYNEPTDREIHFGKGKYLYKILEEKSPEKIISSRAYQELRIDNETKLSKDYYLHLYDEELNFNLGYVGNLPQEENQIMMTDYMAQTTFGTIDVIGREVGISTTFTESFDTYRISGIIKTDYEKKGIPDLYADESYYEENWIDLDYNYQSVYLRKDHYINILKNKHLSNIPGSNFLLTDEPFAIYMNTMFAPTYKTYNENEITSGRKPEADQEVVVSSKFLDRMMIEEKDVLDKEYAYRDISQSINYKLYYKNINFSDILKNVKVVGITNSETADVLVTESVMEKIAQEFYYSGYNRFGIVNPTKSDLQYLLDKGIKLEDEQVNLVYRMEELMGSPLGNAFVIIEIFLILITTLSLITYCHSSIREKKKEIAIMKSLGVPKYKVFSIFYMQNFIQTMMSCIAGIVLGYLLSGQLNQIYIKGLTNYKMRYDIFLIEPSSYYVSFGIAILISAVATFIPFRKVNQIDVVLTLKNSN